MTWSTSAEEIQIISVGLEDNAFKNSYKTAPVYMIAETMNYTTEAEMFDKMDGFYYEIAVDGTVSSGNPAHKPAGSGTGTTETVSKGRTLYIASSVAGAICALALLTH